MPDPNPPSVAWVEASKQASLPSFVSKSTTHEPGRCSSDGDEIGGNICICKFRPMVLPHTPCESRGSGSGISGTHRPASHQCPSRLFSISLNISSPFNPRPVPTPTICAPASRMRRYPASSKTPPIPTYGTVSLGHNFHGWGHSFVFQG